MKPCVLLLALTAIAVGGCSWSPRSPSQLVETAFSPDSPPDQRRQAVDQLAAQSWGRQEKYLKGYALVLKLDPEPTVRAAAARALGRGGDSNFAPDLAAALGDGSPDVRREAAAALDKAPGDVAVEPLIRRSAADSDMDVRANAAVALRRYARRNVIAALVRCLDDEQFTVRYRAHESLVQLTRRDCGYSSADWAPAMSQEPSSMPAPAPRAWWDWRKRD